MKRPLVLAIALGCQAGGPGPGPLPGPDAGGPVPHIPDGGGLHTDAPAPFPDAGSPPPDAGFADAAMPDTF